MTNWFVINLLNCGNLDVEKIEELYEKLPECYDEEFIKYVRNSLFWHTNVDIIGLFFQFVYREVAEILKDRDIQIGRICIWNIFKLFGYQIHMQ